MPIFEPNYLNLEYFFNLIYHWLVGFFPALIRWLAALDFLRRPLIILSLLLLVTVIILVYQIARLRHEEVEEFIAALRTAPALADEKSQRWSKIMSALDSENPADWKQAIIEADILLDEMVKAMNQPGENLGERLKAIEPGDFLNLDAAWEAHKIRNQIAHDGAFVLTRREAGRVLGLYEQAFREFDFI